MKRIFTVVFFSFSVTVFAATKLTDEEVERKATELTMIMAQSLQLNELEYIRVKALNLNKFRAVNEIMDSYNYDLRLRNQKLAEVETAYQWQIRHALSARQIEQYITWQKNVGASAYQYSGRIATFRKYIYA